MPSPTVSAAPSQLRQGAANRGTGWTTLEKVASPAAGASFSYTIDATYWRRLLAFACQIATSAAAGVRQLNLIYQDGDGYIFNLVPLSNELGPSQTLVAYGDQATVTPVEVPESHQVEGSLPTPGPLATIASLVLPSGGWTLNWLAQLTGTLAAADVNNFGLYQGTTQLLQSVNGIIVGQPYPQESIQVQTPIGGATYAVKAIGAGTASSVYSAQLVAQPSNVPTLQVQIPDFILKSGWQLGLQLVGAQAGDQLSGIGLLFERYPSSDIPARDQGYADELAAAILHVMGR